MSTNLWQWLRKSPQPHALMVDGAKKIEVGTKGGKWRDLVQTLEAYPGSRVEALDSGGNPLRALVIADVEVADAPKPQETPEQTFSRIIAGAYKDAYAQATKGPQSLLDNAMAFIEKQAVREQAHVSDIERQRETISKLRARVAELEAQLKHVVDQSGGDDGSIGQMIAAFMQGAAGGGALPANVAPLKPSQGAKKP